MVENANLSEPTRSELGHLGVSVVNHAMDRTYRSQMSSWLSQHSDGAFPIALAGVARVEQRAFTVLASVIAGNFRR